MRVVITVDPRGNLTSPREWHGSDASPLPARGERSDCVRRCEASSGAIRVRGRQRQQRGFHDLRGNRDIYRHSARVIFSPLAPPLWKRPLTRSPRFARTIAKALLRRPSPRTAAEGGLCSPRKRGEVRHRHHSSLECRKRLTSFRHMRWPCRARGEVTALQRRRKVSCERRRRLRGGVS
jgi:hypothetical protein